MTRQSQRRGTPTTSSPSSRATCRWSAASLRGTRTLVLLREPLRAGSAGTRWFHRAPAILLRRLCASQRDAGRTAELTPRRRRLLRCCLRPARLTVPASAQLKQHRPLSPRSPSSIAPLTVTLPGPSITTTVQGGMFGDARRGARRLAWERLARSLHSWVCSSHRSNSAGPNRARGSISRTTR